MEYHAEYNPAVKKGIDSGRTVWYIKLAME